MVEQKKPEPYRLATKSCRTFSQETHGAIAGQLELIGLAAS
jgi:hypothetical protein